jgi:hypothetical protein
MLIGYARVSRGDEAKMKSRERAAVALGAVDLSVI